MDAPTKLRVTLLLAALGVVVGVSGLRLGWFEGLQDQAEDLLQPGTDQSAEIVVVAIDRETLLSVDDAWPWSRGRHAELIGAIAAGDPAVIVYDVLFADARPDDTDLETAMALAPVVLASAMTLQDSAGAPLVVAEVEPADGLRAAAHAVGHANVTLSLDQGVVRSVPLYALDERGLVRPSLALAAVAAAEGARQYIERPAGIQVGARLIPLDAGELRLNYAGSLTGTDAHIVAAVDVLAGDVGPAVFAGKYVVVGVTEPTIGDLHLVPSDKSGSTSGLLVHANALNTIVNQAYLADAGDAGEALVIVFLAVLSAVAYIWARLRFAWVFTAVSLALVVAWTTWRFHDAGRLWNLVWPAIAVLTVAVAGSASRYLGEVRHRRRAASVFAQYVPAGTLEELMTPAAFEKATQGERLEIATLFCDLRGFTPVAAGLEPTQVRELLDHYYEYVTSHIRSHTGTVMQFVGDEVFAVFGAPIAAGDDPARAVACATALVNDIDELDATLESGALPSIRFGVGVHHGPVVAAHVGSPERRQYAVFGDTVNVGSRLCSQAAAGEIIASDQIVELVEGITTDALDSVELKGIDRPVPIHRVRPDVTGAELGP